MFCRMLSSEPGPYLYPNHIIVKMSPTLPDSSGRKTGALWNKESKAHSWCRVGNQAVSHQSAQETQETCWTLRVCWRGLSGRENWTECEPRPQSYQVNRNKQFISNLFPFQHEALEYPKIIKISSTQKSNLQHVGFIMRKSVNWNWLSIGGLFFPTYSFQITDMETKY